MSHDHPLISKRLIPILLLLIASALLYFFGSSYLSFSELQKRHTSLSLFVSNHPILAPCVYVSLYALFTFLCIPVGSAFTLLGGVLFPQPFCTIYVVIGATWGASMLFLVVRYALSRSIKRLLGTRLRKIQQELQARPASYLFFLRLMPIFPFWLVNIAPALLEVAFFPFFLTTLLGIIPGSFAYAQTGRGLSSIFSSGEPFQIKNIFSFHMQLALLSLGVLSLIPVMIRRWKKP
ncbi:MAG: VTT domain-containing protein [Chlamydiota bacterium]